LMKCDARHEIGKELLPHERFSTFSSYIPLHVARGQKIRLRVTPLISPSFKSALLALQEETPHVLYFASPTQSDFTRRTFPAKIGRVSRRP